MVPRAFALTLLAASCRDETPATESAAPTAPAPAASPADRRDVPPKNPVAEPAGVSEPEVWLVFSGEGEGGETAWVEVVDAEAKVVAKVPAVVVSDGTRLWRIDVEDAPLEVLPCECAAEERPPDVDCSPIEHTTVPRMLAVPLFAGDPTDLTRTYFSTGGQQYGDDIDFGVSILGGVDSTLFIETSSSGYFCGAHAMYDTTWKARDVATGNASPAHLNAIGEALPKEVRRKAAEEILPEVASCGVDDDEDTGGLDVDDIVRGMTLKSLRVDVSKTTTVTWDFAYDLPYVCSPEYGAYGSADTGLHPAAASLGLGLPTPAQQAALASAGDGPGGWAKIVATGAERVALLETFRKAATSTEPTPPTGAATLDTGALLDEARKATRRHDYATAIATLDRLLAVDPSHARAWSSRGYAKLLDGDLAGAEADLTTALTKKSDDDSFAAAVYFNLGMLGEKQADTAAAKKAYARSNELRPTKQAAAALDRLGP